MVLRFLFQKVFDKKKKTFFFRNETTKVVSNELPDFHLKIRSSNPLFALAADSPLLAEYKQKKKDEKEFSQVEKTKEKKKNPKNKKKSKVEKIRKSIRLNKPSLRMLLPSKKSKSEFDDDDEIQEDEEEISEEETKPEKRKSKKGKRRTPNIPSKKSRAKKSEAREKFLKVAKKFQKTSTKRKFFDVIPKRKELRKVKSADVKQEMSREVGFIRKNVNYYDFVQEDAPPGRTKDSEKPKPPEKKEGTGEDQESQQFMRPPFKRKRSLSIFEQLSLRKEGNKPLMPTDVRKLEVERKELRKSMPQKEAKKTEESFREVKRKFEKKKEYFRQNKVKMDPLEEKRGEVEEDGEEADIQEGGDEIPIQNVSGFDEEKRKFEEEKRKFLESRKGGKQKEKKLKREKVKKTKKEKKKKKKMEEEKVLDKPPLARSRSFSFKNLLKKTKEKYKSKRNVRKELIVVEEGDEEEEDEASPQGKKKKKKKKKKKGLGKLFSKSKKKKKKPFLKRATTVFRFKLKGRKSPSSAPQIEGEEKKTPEKGDSLNLPVVRERSVSQKVKKKTRNVKSVSLESTPKKGAKKAGRRRTSSFLPLFRRKSKEKGLVISSPLNPIKWDEHSRGQGSHHGRKDLIIEDEISSNISENSSIFQSSGGSRTSEIEGVTDVMDANSSMRSSGSTEFKRNKSSPTLEVPSVTSLKRPQLKRNNTISRLIKEKTRSRSFMKLTNKITRIFKERKTRKMDPSSTFVGKDGPRVNLLMDSVFLKKIGMGLTKCLFGVKVAVMTDKSKRKSDKWLCLCRDFCGNFALFVMNTKKSEMVAIRDVFPLISSPKFENVNISGDNLKFRFTIEGETFLFRCLKEEKEKFEKILMEILENFSPRKNSKENFVRRIASVDLANSFGRPRFLQIDTETLVLQILRNKTSLASKENVLRMKARDTHERESILDVVLRFRDGTEFRKGSHLQNVLNIYQVIITTPMRTAEEPLQRFREMLEGLLGDDTHRVQCHELASGTKGLLEAQGAFLSRGNLPDVEFSSSSYVKKEKIVYHEPQISFQNKYLKEGVYISVMFVCGDEILEDLKGNLPAVKIKDASVQQLSDFEDFEWILSFWGQNLEQILGKKANFLSLTSNFRENFVNAAWKLSSIFKSSDLGIIFPKLITLRGKKICKRRRVTLAAKSVTFLTVKKISKKKFVNFGSNFRWKKLFIFEHKLYQKYCGISIIKRMERINDRFILDALTFHKIMTESIPAGFYLGFLRFLEKPDGVYVLVQRESINMIPCEYVCTDLPSLKAWNQIQKLRFNNRVSLGGSTGSFIDLFRHSYFKLKESIPLLDIRQLYDFSILPIDEDSQIRFCVFAEIVSENRLNPLERESYRWIKLSLFEKFFFPAYWRRTYALFQHERARAMTPNDSIFATDEILKYPINFGNYQSKFFKLIDLEKKFFSVKWHERVYEWCRKGSKSITGGEKNPKNFKKFINERNRDYFLKERYSQIQKLFKRDGLDWSKIERELNIMEEKSRQDRVPKSTKSELDSRRIFGGKKTVPVNFDEIFDNVGCATETTVVRGICSDLVQEIVEKSLIFVCDKPMIETCATVLTEMVDTICCVEEMKRQVELNVIKEKMEGKMLRERNILRKFYKKNFQSLGPSQNEGRTYDCTIDSFVGDFGKLMGKAKTMIKVINSIQDCIEVDEKIQNFERVMEKRDRIDNFLRVEKDNCDFDPYTVGSKRMYPTFKTVEKNIKGRTYSPKSRKTYSPKSYSPKRTYSPKARDYSPRNLRVKGIKNLNKNK